MSSAANCKELSGILSISWLASGQDVWKVHWAKQRELSTWSRLRLTLLLLTVSAGPGLISASYIEKKMWCVHKPDKSVQPLKSVQTRIPHSSFCPVLCPALHWEQFLAYKRRIPQADSRLIPPRAWLKLKGYSLVFSRLYVCDIDMGTRN